MEGPLAARLEVGESREKEFCAITQVAKPRLGGTERGESREGKCMQAGTDLFLSVYSSCWG